MWGVGLDIILTRQKDRKTGDWTVCLSDSWVVKLYNNNKHYSPASGGAGHFIHIIYRVVTFIS